MVKKLFISALVLGSAMAHSTPLETQAIANMIVATFNLNHAYTAVPNSKKDADAPDSQAHLKANIQTGAGSAPALLFKDAKSLALTVNPRLLNELTQSASVTVEDGGALRMTAQAKSRLAFGAVNMAGIVEARSVIIRDGVVVLSGLQPAAF